MEEFFDVFDRSGNYLGVKPKSFCHSKEANVYHKPVWIWVLNNKGQVLLQKRAQTKKWLPNKWDSAATGHVSAGESIVKGCKREVFEELGLVVGNEGDFKFLFEYVADSVWEIGQVYLLKSNKPVTEMTMQVEEVSQLKWFDFADFEKMFFSDNFVPYDNDYKLLIIKNLKQLI